MSAVDPTFTSCQEDHRIDLMRVPGAGLRRRVSA
jgi:hypothetical protein